MFSLAAYITVAVAVAASAEAAKAQAAAELLDLVASRHSANLGQIRTWRGKVLLVTEWSAVSVPGSVRPPRHEDASITFVLDETRGSRRSNYVQTTCVEIVNETQKDAPIREVGVMVKDGARYEYTSYPRGYDVLMGAVDGASPKGAPTSKRVEHIPPAKIKGSTIVKAASEPPFSRYRDDDFNPIEHMSCRGEDIAGRFRVFCNPMKNGRVLPDATIRREGETVTLSLESAGITTRYTVALDKGGCLTAYEHNEGPNGPIDKWSCSLQRVSGVWIPKHVDVFRLTSFRANCAQSLDWVENVINQPVSNAEFSLVKLVMRRGDTVQDGRTGASFIVTGDEYPPAED